MDINETNAMQIVGSDGLLTTFTIPAGSLSAASASALQARLAAPGSGASAPFTIVRTEFGPGTSAMSFTGSPYGIIQGNQGLNYISSTRELLIFTGGSGNASLMTNFSASNPPTVTVQFAPPTGAAMLNPDSITLYYLDPTNNLRPAAVPGATLDLAAHTVTAQILKPGVYFIGSPLGVDLSAAFAYPVPFKASQHQSIKFTKLGADSTIKIYTIMGELVAQLHNDNNEILLEWPVKNSDGEPVASGVYIYQIKNSLSEKRGKLIIIR
jgi:hypothetical protein